MDSEVTLESVPKKLVGKEIVTEHILEYQKQILQYRSPNNPIEARLLHEAQESIRRPLFIPMHEFVRRYAISPNSFASLSSVLTSTPDFQEVMEEIAENAFLAVMEKIVAPDKIETFDITRANPAVKSNPQEAFLRWAMRLATNTVLDQIQKATDQAVHERHGDLALMKAAETKASQTGATEYRELPGREIVIPPEQIQHIYGEYVKDELEAIRALAAKQPLSHTMSQREIALRRRQAVLAQVLQGVDYATIARQHHITENTVKSDMYRIRERVLERLLPKFPGFKDLREIIELEYPELQLEEINQQVHDAPNAQEKARLIQIRKGMIRKRGRLMNTLRKVTTHMSVLDLTFGKEDQARQYLAKRKRQEAEKGPSKEVPSDYVPIAQFPPSLCFRIQTERYRADPSTLAVTMIGPNGKIYMQESVARERFETFKPISPRHIPGTAPDMYTASSIIDFEKGPAKDEIRLRRAIERGIVVGQVIRRNDTTYYVTTREAYRMWKGQLPPQALAS